MLPVQYEMNVMALITLSLVLPPVLELMSAHAENDGITKLTGESAGK